jgi:hypothetical protein
MNLIVKNNHLIIIHKIGNQVLIQIYTFYYKKCFKIKLISPSELRIKASLRSYRSSDNPEDRI